MKILTSTPLKYNQYQNQSKNRQVQSFGINPSSVLSKSGELVTDGMAYGFGWLASTRPVQGLINVLKDTNYQRHISAFVGVVLSGYYMLDTARSKRIEKDQKMPLIVNQGTVSVLSTIGAYSLDGWLDNKLENAVDTMHIANINNENYRKAMIEYHSNKNSYEVMEQTAKKLTTPVKAQRQLVAKSLLEVADNPEEFAKLLNSLKNDKTAQKLFAEVKIDNNAKENLKKFYERTDLFGEVLQDRFQLKNKDIKSLNKLVAKGKADDAVEALVGKLNTLANDKHNRLKTATEMFLEDVEKSPVLKKMFAKSSFQTSIDLLGASDSKLYTRMKGLRFAKSIMVFAMIYRFVSPVVATPIANSFSSKIEEHKKAKKTA